MNIYRNMNRINRQLCNNLNQKDNKYKTKNNKWLNNLKTCIIANDTIKLHHRI